MSKDLPIPEAKTPEAAGPPPDGLAEALSPGQPWPLSATEKPSGSQLPHAPRSIHELNNLPEEWKEALCRILIPSPLLIRFGIHPIKLTNQAGQRLVSFRYEPGSFAVQLLVRHRPDAEDPLYLLELQENPLGQTVVAFMATNDPSAERFHVDRDEEGQLTLLGTARRHLAEEVRAMRAGLAPGQVREGLRLFSHVMPRVEAFLIALGQDSVIVEPLGYHNAILFERYGFMYTQGQREMEWIQQAFQPGGELAARLDGSTPFRQPEAAHSVRGRSWAIHDGILGKPWDGVKMIRRLAPPAGVDTAPGLPW